MKVRILSEKVAALAIGAEVDIDDDGPTDVAALIAAGLVEPLEKSGKAAGAKARKADA